MRKFTGTIRTNKVGSDCEFEFEVPDDATEEEIEETAKDAAFNWIEWNYSEEEAWAPTSDGGLLAAGGVATPRNRRMKITGFGADKTARCSMSARKIKRSLLVCPSCGNDGVIVREVTAIMVNTGEHFCHSVKAHDDNAKTKCLACDWEGERKDLKEQSA